MFWLGILFTIIFMGLINMFIVMMKELPKKSLKVKEFPKVDTQDMTAMRSLNSTQMTRRKKLPKQMPP